MRNKSTIKGFTLIEILVVISILAILVTISAVTFRNLSAAASHRVATQEVYIQLTDARNNTLASDNDTVYGVHFESGSTTLFEGATFIEGDANNVVYEFEGGTYATSTLITENIDIIFKRLTGLPTATGTMFIVKNDGLATGTITVRDSGLIEN